MVLKMRWGELRSRGGVPCLLLIVCGLVGRADRGSPWLWYVLVPVAIGESFVACIVIAHARRKIELRQNLRKMSATSELFCVQPLADHRGHGCPAVLQVRANMQMEAKDVCKLTDSGPDTASMLRIKSWKPITSCIWISCISCLLNTASRMPRNPHCWLLTHEMKYMSCLKTLYPCVMKRPENALQHFSCVAQVPRVSSNNAVQNEKKKLLTLEWKNRW